MSIFWALIPPTKKDPWSFSHVHLPYMLAENIEWHFTCAKQMEDISLNYLQGVRPEKFSKPFPHLS